MTVPTEEEEEVDGIPDIPGDSPGSAPPPHALVTGGITTIICSKVWISNCLYLGVMHVPLPPAAMLVFMVVMVVV